MLGLKLHAQYKPWLANFCPSIPNFSKSKCLGEAHQSKCKGEMLKEKNEPHHHWIYICNDFKLFLRPVRIRLCTKILFACRFGESKVPTSNICNSCYNGPTANKSSLTKIFVQLFQPSVKEFLWFSSYPNPISEIGLFFSFSSYSNFSTLLKNLVTNKSQL